MAERKSPCRRLSLFCGNFDELIVKIDGFAKKVDNFLMMWYTGVKRESKSIFCTKTNKRLNFHVVT